MAVSSHSFLRLSQRSTLYQSLLERKNLDKNAIWQFVKDARRPEGMVVDQLGQAVSQNDLLGRRREFNLSLIQEKLNSIKGERAELEKLVAITEARQDLLDLALVRLQNLQKLGEMECGWDTRWLWDDSEIQHGFENGSIRNGLPDISLNGNGNKRASESVSSTPFSWWCIEGRECPRHQGWVKVLQEDLELERSDQVSFLL
jgi:hypothetical protein